MAAIPTHHQKMVLIDYEEPDAAIGFVMGHNTLDAYWDTDKHSYMRMHPAMGHNDFHPRQDMSSRVSGPILQYLNDNFCEAWDLPPVKRSAACGNAGVAHIGCEVISATRR